jgi:hypothetical protein
MDLVLKTVVLKGTVGSNPAGKAISLSLVDSAK